MQFCGAPVIFLVAKLGEDYRGFCFSGSVNPPQNQFPATLWRGQPQNSLNDQ
ncbi:replication protein RepA [Salmonella enterica subsp. enterica serovar Reading]|nr:replication protein RepA [Salmonella enterica subsp. enterica serovar Milwaukee str. SA19950795]ECD3768635.1 replication protein RepA [Salmonella enterica subsp. enterica serovar Onderstepoort]ECE8819367.1 replication protein RepA [Salmonella enterica subsp. enterica serovar Reading]ECI2686020.1 replication protein RepA [Salmonella enterica subsp. enterica]EEL6674614.1 replication protein RepA [Salmonella enterica subsp. enterica serovar Reading]